MYPYFPVFEVTTFVQVDVDMATPNIIIITPFVSSSVLENGSRQRKEIIRSVEVGRGGRKEGNTRLESAGRRKGRAGKGATLQTKYCSLDTEKKRKNW